MINRLRTFLADPKVILDAVDSESYSGSEQSQLIERSREIAEDLGGSAPDKVKATLLTLLCRMEIRSGRIDITLSRGKVYLRYQAVPIFRHRGAENTSFPRRQHAKSRP